MKLSLCTISFRHQLISFGDIVRFAERHRFDGIELWGVHARQMYEREREEALAQLDVMRSAGLAVSMISDYIDMGGSADRQAALVKGSQLADMARWFGARRIRIFAGTKASMEMTAEERADCVRLIRELSERCADKGVELLVETHPGTLADTLASTIRLIHEVEHKSLGINLDFLHLWESGTDPVAAFRQLEPWVRHFHLKNISSADKLEVFLPQHVYAAGASRDGIVPLGEGAIDYAPILQRIADTEWFGSLEWFGHDPCRVLAAESAWVQSICGAAEHQTEPVR
ncbi:sugar phosphate isomerase/epimerase [Paenibacillus sambharensis]|uniref:Sugar phosphate isomerase/epimerase n=1 Tax=Paenibacillus sambharensis TaxID=1803190 RepID=A0A2W1LLL5_9BACL|nr:sugar phosphate isomerase/epimerase [Paenibacillus sambharensis]PZD95404.1 sugar phosphate isomerase/epimerase [Paenibacillus sambharensis]